MVVVHRELENIARERAAVPKVGQGWLSETEMFNLIANTFGTRTAVVQHGHPEGFGRQHLDVWLPQWKVGVEYQGLQHDQPIAYFGGEEAWILNVARDQLKREKCESGGIKLIEVRPGYDIAGLLAAIDESSCK
jgi:hypothetical protein